MYLNSTHHFEYAACLVLAFTRQTYMAEFQGF